jgi:hypothetical protein
MTKTDIDDATGVTTQDADKTAQSIGNTVGLVLGAAALLYLRNQAAAQSEAPVKLEPVSVEVQPDIQDLGHPRPLPGGYDGPSYDANELPPSGGTTPPDETLHTAYRPEDAPAAISLRVGSEQLNTDSARIANDVQQLDNLDVVQWAIADQSRSTDPEVEIQVGGDRVFHQSPEERYVHPEFDLGAASELVSNQRGEMDRNDGAVVDVDASPLHAAVGRVDREVPDVDADTVQKQADEIGAQVNQYAPDKTLSVRVDDKQFTTNSDNLSTDLITEFGPADIDLLHQSLLHGQYHNEVVAISDTETGALLYHSDSDTRYSRIASTQDLKEQQINWNDSPPYEGLVSRESTEVVALSTAEAIAGQNEGDVSTDNPEIYMAQPTMPTVTRDGKGQIVSSPSMEGLEATVDLVERKEDRAEHIEARLQGQQANVARSQEAGQVQLATMFDRCLEACYGEEGSATIVGSSYDISRDGQGGLAVTAKDGRGTIFERDGQSGDITSAATSQDLQKFALGAAVLEQQQARGASMPSLAPKLQSPISRARQSDMEIG